MSKEVKHDWAWFQANPASWFYYREPYAGEWSIRVPENARVMVYLVSPTSTVKVLVNADGARISAPVIESDPQAGRGAG